MFEDQQLQNQPINSNPLNPVIPAPGMTPPVPGNVPPTPPPVLPPQPQIHTMPDKFQAGSGRPKGSGGNRRLIIILVVVIVFAALVAGGLYFFNRFLVKENNTNNQNVTTNEELNLNTDDLNANENLNLNTNENLNTNTNLNSNENLNTNTNLNSNSNANVNVSTNANTNTAVSTEPLPTTLDTDSDGLTDIEEAVYGTSTTAPDTDADGYIDGKKVQADGTIIGELYLGYDPIHAGAKLETATIVKRVTNSTSEYSILVPSKWTTTNSANGGLLVTPNSTTGEYIQVRIVDNTARLTPTQWYLQNNPSADTGSLTTLAINGLEGLMTEDYSTAYLFNGAKVYSIQYVSGTLTAVNFRTTFDMIIRNFKLVAAS